MNKLKAFTLTTVASLALVALTACGPESSPEGRMSLQLDKMHKEMIDSLHKQNRAILDSLAKMREDINELRRQTR